MDYDSPVVAALVERARSPLDSGSIHVEVTRALKELDLSRRDRGRLLLAQLILLQGTLSATEAVAQADEIMELLDDVTDVDLQLSALAIGATISAAAGDRATCLERCLEMSGIIRSNPDGSMTFRAAGNFGAALIVLGAYDLAAPLFVRAIWESMHNDEMTGVVISCANLAITVSRRALVNGNAIVTDSVGIGRLDAIDAALHQIKSMQLGQEMRAFVDAILSDSAQMRGDLAAADAHWGDLDAFTAHPSASFTQYLCLVEAPLALRRGEVARARVLLERTLEHLSTPHVVPLGRVDALKLRSVLHEQVGDVDAALKDARDATDLALKETSGFADLLIAQVDTRAALEYSQQTLLDRAHHLSEQALLDELSQVGNRRAYEGRIEALRARPAHTVAVLLCDIDHFKHINDRFGHAIGDAVITRAGAIASEACGGPDNVFRYGGDEFAVLAESMSGDDAASLAERIRSAFEAEPWAVSGIPIQIRCSVGAWIGLCSSIDQGLAEADKQLYEAKKDGRNAVRVATVS